MTNAQLERAHQALLKTQRRLLFEQKLHSVHTTRVNLSNRKAAAKRPGKGHRNDWRKEL